MALPDGNGVGMGLEEAVEASLEDLQAYLEPADLSLVTSIRMAARLIDQLADDEQPAKAMSYMYLVRDGMEKLGGSVAARKALGQRPEHKANPLAGVRGQRGRTTGKGSAQDRRGLKVAGE